MAGPCPEWVYKQFRADSPIANSQLGQLPCSANLSTYILFNKQNFSSLRSSDESQTPKSGLRVYIASGL